MERAFEEAQAKRDADRRVADEALLEARRDAESKLQESKVLVRKAEDTSRGREISGGLVSEMRRVGTAAPKRTVGARRRQPERQSAVSELEERLSASKNAFERSRDEASERRTELERRLRCGRRILRKESDRRATELSELRDAHQATLKRRSPSSKLCGMRVCARLYEPKGSRMRY